MAYITIADLAAYLGITADDDDALLGSLIARAQKAIESYTGRVFEHGATGVTRNFTVGKDTSGKVLMLDDDLCAISANGVITNADNGSNGIIIPTAEYITCPRNRTPYWAIEILGSSSNYWRYTNDAAKGITITGKWAYSATPPADIVHATIRYAAWLYRGKDVQIFDYSAQITDVGSVRISQKIPADILQILAPYVKANL